MKAEITVVIPCFKCHETIHRAFDSIVNQTTLPKEIILIDDYSNDQKTLPMLYAIKAQYENLFTIKVIGLPRNSGAATARNTGWDNATQPFIALLDADDAWHPKKIETQYNFMLNHTEIALCGHDKKVVDIVTLPQWDLESLKSHQIKKTNALISNPFVTPSVMFKRSLPFRFEPTKRYVDDHLLWLEILLANYKVAFISLPLVAIYKPMFGASGLSSHLWQMEKSELDNYRRLLKNKKIGFLATLALLTYSFTKFIRRLILVAISKK
jgi:glycosyltransferase involved in cell wall biosynthesis